MNVCLIQFRQETLIMVVLKLINTFGETRLYHYWPEGDKSRLPGFVRVNLSAYTIDLVEPAELDEFLYYLREGKTERPVWRYFEGVRAKLCQQNGNK